MKKLFIFNKITKQIIGKHNFWDEAWKVEDKWRNFDPTKQIALIIDKNIGKISYLNEHTKDQKVQLIQPKDYNKLTNTDYEYIDKDILDAHKKSLEE